MSHLRSSKKVVTLQVVTHNAQYFETWHHTKHSTQVENPRKGNGDFPTCDSVHMWALDLSVRPPLSPADKLTATRHKSRTLWTTHSPTCESFFLCLQTNSAAAGLTIFLLCQLIWKYCSQRFNYLFSHRFSLFFPFGTVFNHLYLYALIFLFYCLWLPGKLA